MWDDQRGGFRPRGLLLPRQALCSLSYALKWWTGRDLHPHSPFGALRLQRSWLAHARPIQRDADGYRPRPPGFADRSSALAIGVLYNNQRDGGRGRDCTCDLSGISRLLRLLSYTPAMPPQGRRDTMQFQVDLAGIEPAFSSSELVVFPLDDRPVCDGGARGSRTHMIGVQNRHLAIG